MDDSDTSIISDIQSDFDGYLDENFNLESEQENKYDPENEYEELFYMEDELQNEEESVPVKEKIKSRKDKTKIPKCPFGYRPLFKKTENGEVIHNGFQKDLLVLITEELKRISAGEKKHISMKKRINDFRKKHGWTQNLPENDKIIAYFLNLYDPPEIEKAQIIKVDKRYPIFMNYTKEGYTYPPRTKENRMKWGKISFLTTPAFSKKTKIPEYIGEEEKEDFLEGITSRESEESEIKFDEMEGVKLEDLKTEYLNQIEQLKELDQEELEPEEEQEEEVLEDEQLEEYSGEHLGKRYSHKRGKDSGDDLIDVNDPVFLNHLKMNMISRYRKDPERLEYLKLALNQRTKLDLKTKLIVEQVIKGNVPEKPDEEPGPFDELHSATLDKILFYNPESLPRSSKRNVGLLEYRRIIAKYPCARVEAPEELIAWYEPLFIKQNGNDVKVLRNPEPKTKVDFIGYSRKGRIWRQISNKTYRNGRDIRRIPLTGVYTSPRLARYIFSNPTIPYTMIKMNKRVVVMVRHGESVWNQKNLFCGWYDAELSETGESEAHKAGMTLCRLGYKFDIAHTSLLKRAFCTLEIIKEGLCQDIPIYKTWRLNERHYGGLTGLNKSETAAKYGEEQVKIWRRSFDIPPPPMERDHKYYDSIVNHPALKTDGPSEDEFPMYESLKMTMERTLPYWDSNIVPDLKAGKRVIIVAHGNSLRAIVKHIDCLSDEAIMEINLPTGIPFLYEFDKDMKVVTSMKFLGSEEDVKKAMESVAAQGKAK